MRRTTRALALLAAGLSMVSTTMAWASPAVAPQAGSRTPVAVLRSTSAPAVTRTAYRNPVSRPFADTFADPSVIRGKDGWWYAYGTSDPLRSGQTTAPRIPISRSRDLVTWRYVGEAFSATTLPSWAAGGAGLWAPDIRYVNGHYRLYYVVTETTVTSEPNDNAIGMATAPTPAGPWTDSGAPVVGPRRGASGASGDFLWTFDPSVVSDDHGGQWIFYGSYNGGVFTQQLAADGRTRVGGPTMVAIDNKFEGAYVVRHAGWWYLFASTANCCAGPTTGYSVQVGRSRSLTGPYVDQQGVSLLASRTGGTPVLNQNGNRWVGAGHNAIATDLAGQDWIVYHAINRDDPYLTGTAGINQRPMLLDRLDWVRGWPAVRAGRGPSASAQQGPATGGTWVTGFDTGVPARWARTGGWTARTGQQPGGYVQSRGPAQLRSGPVRGGARVEADLRSAGSAYGLTADLNAGARVRVLVQPRGRVLKLVLLRHGRVVRSTTRPLPSGFAATAWHALVLQVSGARATATLSNAGLGDPLAVAQLRVPAARSVRAAGVVAGGAGVGVDNLSVLPPAHLVTRLVSDRVPHHLDPKASDEFSSGALGAGWTWVRPDADATVRSGTLRWPTEAGDLSGSANDAGVLLRDPGAGPWTIQTKLTIDLGTDTVRNYSQAGLIAYVNDDLFTRFSHVAIWNTRQTEFGKEMPYAGGLSYGGTIVGPPAKTTWLRLTHRVDPRNGEHELRAWSSRDGRTWVKGGVWTLPAGSRIRVGLISQGGVGATAEFDYFRLYR